METVWVEHPIEYERYPRRWPGTATREVRTRRRRFWCAEAGREVEVLFEKEHIAGDPAPSVG